MTMTDPLADMLTRLRNASMAHAEEAAMPSSKIKVNFAEILKQEGYIASYEVTDTKPQATLTVQLKYGRKRERVITGLKRVSKPGLRVYVKHDEIPRVLGGLGVAVLSTNAGLMTDGQARKDGRGGELLAYVW
ncbi:MAG TPA: 30S ribosomal protein S8 [Nitriliruptoraceae bacterium]|nr:30S ribosomal protein S8 [Nitriliruptoraceae bacterium]